MIRPLTLLAMLLVAGPAAAQADLFGVVADAESAGPIVGAAVVLTDSAGTVRGRGAGTEGQFVFRGLLSGRYVLRVTALGYAPLVDTLALADGERRDERQHAGVEGQREAEGARAGAVAKPSAFVSLEDDDFDDEDDEEDRN